jgi:magnesium transporter
MKQKAGKAPGELLPANESAHPTLISLITYNEKNYQNITIKNPDEIPALLSEGTCNWIHISGFKDIEKFKHLGEIFQINPLIIEDVLNPEHLPKAEELDHKLFVTLKSVLPAQQMREYSINHYGFILSAGLFISFSQYDTATFDNFIARIEQAIGKVRQRREDYLLYRTMDIITDNYFAVFDSLEDELFELEEEISNTVADESAGKITELKKYIYELKKVLLPSSEALYTVLRLDTTLIKKANRGFYNDVLDHIKHLLQALEGFRESSIGLMELHKANSANRMNEVMMTLTIIATIFIPLTFVAGIYGMNFQYMPELTYRWGYPALLIAMLLMGLGMYLFMKRKKWF